MKLTRKIVFFAALFSVITGCSTSGSFIVPDDTNLYINKRPQPVTIEESGKVITRPYFWSSISGVPYRLEKDGETVKEGKLKSNFRPISIFWPRPYKLPLH